MRKYDLKFDNGEEFVKRLDIFAAKTDEIEIHNAGNFTVRTLNLQFVMHSFTIPLLFVDSTRLGTTLSAI